MKAMILQRNAPIESSPLEWKEIPDPNPGEGEVRIRVEFCAICRTDLHVIEGDLPSPRFPRVPGHQVVGIVERLGAGCQRFAPGERVGVAWLGETCQRCEYCRSDKENLCIAPTFTGYDRDGGFAERIVAKEAFVHRIPDSFAAENAAPLLCAGIIGYRALERAQLPDGGALGIFGFGSSAHIVIQIARARGAQVFVVTRALEHQRLALKLGALWASDSIAGMPVRLDSAVLFAPAGDWVPSGLSALKRGGTLAVAGIHLSEIPQLNYERHLFYERDLRSVTANTRKDATRLLALASRISIRPEIMVYPAHQANRALQDLKADRISGTGVLDFTRI